MTLDGTIAGDGEVISHVATISGLTIANSATFVVPPYPGGSEVVQTGLLTIGSAGGGSALVVNNNYWDLAENGARIVPGSASGSRFLNQGDLADTAAGTTSISGIFTNGGAIESDAAGGTLVFAGGTFSNSGASSRITAAGGDIVFGPGETNADLVAGTLGAGIWEADKGGTLAITGGPIVTDASSIALEDPGSELEGGNGTTFTPIQQSLATIAEFGELYLFGVAYSTAIAMTVAGGVFLDGYTVVGNTFSDSSGLQVTRTGDVTGFDATVAGAVTNYGTIASESEGTLTMAGAVTNFGTMTASGTSIFTGSLINHGVLNAEYPGQVINVAGPHNLIGGRTMGQGELLFSGGSTTITAGARGTISRAALSGGATLVVESSVPRFGSFTDTAIGAASTLDLDGHTANVTHSIFGGSALIDGGGTFNGIGTMNLGGLALDGGSTLANSKLAKETGSLALGDASGGTASIVNNKGATWDITNAVSISAASATADTISNAGLFEMTGTGTAKIGAAFTNTGTIDVTSGTLEITAPFTNTGTIIGTEIRSGGTTFITAPSAALFNQYAAAMDSSTASAPLVMPASLAEATMKLAVPHSG